ncbi:MAG TPA: hypothetical protein VIZ28_14145 [Chitinophagaceae bacterium]
MFVHILFTWLLANLLHPLLLALAIYLPEGDTGFFSVAEFISVLIQVSFYSLIISLPCLFLGWGLLYVIVSTKDIILVKFIEWLFASAMLIVLELMGIIFLVDDSVEMEHLLFTLPAIGATWIAIAIRYKQFRNLIGEHKTNDPESDPV